jgi:hypothetical protein
MSFHGRFCPWAGQPIIEMRKTHPNDSTTTFDVRKTG